MSEARRATVLGGTLVAPGVRWVRLRLSDGDRLGHRAGQYVLLHARAEDGSVVKRAYSIASPPADDPAFELCVRLVPGHPASTSVHGLTAGDEVSFSGPWGKFVVDDEAPDLTLVATGTAISCTGAILRGELAQHRPRRVRLLWGLRHDHDVHGRERLDALVRAHPRFSYRIALSRSADPGGGERARVTDLLRANLWPEGLYYLAGNGSMVADADVILATAGIPPAAIHKGVFFTPAEVRISLGERQARAANRLRAGRAVVGLALHAGTPGPALTAAIEEALAQAKIDPGQVRNLAVAARASDEPGLTEAAAALAIPVEFYLPAELEAAAAATGVTSACETLASVSAGSIRLILPKVKTSAVTLAIAAVAERESKR